ncbi:MAG: hypothetical protein NVSMB52_15960 [Chloroflexota bacterium]
MLLRIGPECMGFGRQSAGCGSNWKLGSVDVEDFLDVNTPEMPAFDFILAGRYRLLGPLGEGGMASVYRARDLRLNRDVAVKLLREDLTRDPEFLRRFEREAQYVASLSHPNIVPVYDVGEENGSHYIVMEFIRGRTLKDAIESGGPLPAGRAAEITVSVLDALQYAHGRGLVHRDVKPHNILMTADGTARLADFGIAHLADSSTTRTAAILGSAQYLSPEQARGDEATPLSDVYSCGIVLYEMVTGAPPFGGANALAVAHHHVYSDPPPLPQRARDEMPELESIVARALAKDPSDRFADAQSFIKALSLLHDSDATHAMTISAEKTAALQLVDAAKSPAAPAMEETFVLRRSARKTVMLAILLALLVGGAAIVLNQPLWGYSLPAYPSPPYAAIPTLMAIALVIAWFNVRSWSYRMDGNAAVVHWGLLTHRRFGVPLRHITTLELKQSPLERLLGVGTIELCARDEHGMERRVVMEDLRRPRQTYDTLARSLGRLETRQSRLES